MRSIILATALALAPAIALAQPTSPPPGAPPGSTVSPVAPGNPPPEAVQGNDSARNVAQPDPNNCGTPDEPKACPPIPRHALNYYPQNK
jgi:hypothetical protein